MGLRNLGVRFFHEPVLAIMALYAVPVAVSFVLPPSPEPPPAECGGEETAPIAYTIDGTTITFLEVEAPLLVRARAGFGPWEHRWVVGPVDPDESGNVAVDLAVPEEAFLHELASDYVTDLALVVRRTEGSSFWPGMDLFLAWPEGPESPPVVWDLAQQQVNAQWGIVDDELRGRMPPDDRPNKRILPPVFHLANAPVETNQGDME